MENISDKKKAIFESTLDLIVEHGFHGTPMSLVAKTAGVAAGTIYHYFESKDELIVALYDYTKSRVVEVIDKAISGNITHKERFLNIWRRLFEFYSRNIKVLDFYEQYVNSPYNRTKRPDFFRGQLFDFFQEGIDHKLIKPVRPEILIVITMNSIITSAKLNNANTIPMSDQDIHQILNIMWDGIALRHP